MSLGPIPWSAIRAYSKDWEYTSEEASDFYDLIRAMDNAFMKFEKERLAEKTRAEAAARNPAGPNPS